MADHSIGLIGYGGFGRFLRSAWSEIDGVAVAAIADEDPIRDPGGVRFFEDWRQCVSDRDIDIIAIVTPPATHAGMALAAIKARKHVLVEKPVAVSVEDARDILIERDRSDRVVSVDFMLRFNPIVEVLRAWCLSGSFGELRRVAVENFAQDESLPPQHWFWDSEVSGGILVEHAVHFLDLVRWCSGSDPIRVDGVGIRRRSGQEDRMLATVVHESGLVASHFHSFAGPRFFERTSMRFVFDLLEVVVDGWIPMSGRLRAIVNSDSELELARLPGYHVTHREVVPELAGAHSKISAESAAISPGGQAPGATAIVEGEFAVAGTKSEEYARSLRALMSDFVCAIDDPHHELRVSLEDGIASLETALAATEDAHRR